MSYYKDLTKYTYTNYIETDNMVNIGWLSQNNDYPKGQVPEEFLKKLFELSEAHFCQTRGMHFCELCELESEDFNPIKYNGKEYFLGSAEIHVEGAEGKRYAAPNLICHYILEHNYRPPEEFIEATLATDVKKAIKAEKKRQKEFLQSLLPEKKTNWKKIIIICAFVLGLLFLSYSCFNSMFGPSAGAVISDINEIGIENLKSDADLLFAKNREDILKENLPEHIAKLKPDKVSLIHDGNIVLIVLKEFNGTTETGIYIYKDKSVPKRKYEIQKVDDRVSIYKMLD